MYPASSKPAIATTDSSVLKTAELTVIADHISNGRCWNPQLSANTSMCTSCTTGDRSGSYADMVTPAGAGWSATFAVEATMSNEYLTGARPKRVSRASAEVSAWDTSTCPSHGA